MLRFCFKDLEGEGEFVLNCSHQFLWRCAVDRAIPRQVRKKWCEGRKVSHHSTLFTPDVMGIYPNLPGNSGFFQKIPSHQIHMYTKKDLLSTVIHFLVHQIIKSITLPTSHLFQPPQKPWLYPIFWRHSWRLFVVNGSCPIPTALSVECHATWQLYDVPRSFPRHHDQAHHHLLVSWPP